MNTLEIDFETWPGDPNDQPPTSTTLEIQEIRLGQRKLDMRGQWELMRQLEDALTLLLRRNAARTQAG